MRSVFALIILICQLFAGVAIAQKMNAYEHLRAAEQMLDENDEDEALDQLYQCLELQPTNEEALFLRARINYNKQNYLQTLTDYNMLLSLSPDNKEALYGRGSVKYLLKQYKSALEDFVKCWQAPSQGTKTAYFKTDPAQQLASGISTINQMEVDIWNYIGLCHFHLGALDKAIHAYSAGLKLDSIHADLLINRALANQKKNLSTLARADYETVLSHYPGHPTASINIISLLNESEQLKNMHQFIEEHPDLASGYAERANYYYSHQQFIKAEDDFACALRLEPTEVEHQLNLAITKLKLDKLEEAEELLMNLVEKDLQNGRIYFNLGNVKYKLLKFEEAKAYLTLAIQLDPHTASYYYNRALCYAELKKTNLACQDAILANELDPKIGKDFIERNCPKH